MIYSLENDFLSVKIDSFGAELSSMMDKRDCYEYIWHGDSRYWSKKAPNLFPIIGNLNNDRYKFQEKEYIMKRHGFAKDMEFSKVDSSSNKCIFCITYDNNTMRQYPFKFKLFVTYLLSGTTLTVKYSVENIDEKDIWFSIGGHPGFCCKVNSEGRKEGKILFPIKETVNCIENKSGYLTGVKKTFMTEENTINIGSLDFDGETKVYILEKLQSEHLILEDIWGEKRVCIKFNEFPYIGIWSPSNEAPFICVEPWYGITSTRDEECNFTKKQGMIKLGAKKTFSCSFEITCEY